jgi:hypothetical protein
MQEDCGFNIDPMLLKFNSQVRAIFNVIILLIFISENSMLNTYCIVIKVDLKNFR